MAAADGRKGADEVASNRGVVYQGPGKVSVESIDYPEFVLKPGPDVPPANAGPAITVAVTAGVGAGGAIGIPGLYVTEDPGASDPHAQRGALSLRFGVGWAKAHSFATGQCPAMRYHRELMMAILNDRVQIAKNVNATVITLDDAPRGYQEFDQGVPKKFVLTHMVCSARHSRPPPSPRSFACRPPAEPLPGAASGAGPTFSAPLTVGMPRRRVRPLQAPRRSR
jgi:hypothetical protein